jgi:predicted FMN-binding regulatory protein PaiB
MKKAMISVEQEVTRIHGNREASQELARGDREGVIKGLSDWMLVVEETWREL